MIQIPDWVPAPGVSQYDIRQFEHDISYTDLLHTALGVVIGTALLAPGPLLAALLTELALGFAPKSVYGFQIPWFNGFLFAYKIAVVCTGILMLIRFSKENNNTDGDNQ